MSDETEPRTGTEPYTALVFTIGTGIMLTMVILAVGVVAAWNDTDATSGASRDEAALEGGEGNHTELDFGEPAEPATANRVIEMEMLDSLAFDPASVEVAQGETVTFRVTNAGKLVHDFTLGDGATQEAHAAEMADMGPMGEMGGEGDPNAMTVEPGETKELTWNFTESGGLLIGCQIPGHFEAGMVSDVTVT